MATDNLMPQSSMSVIKHFMLRSSTTGQGLTGKVASDFSGKYNIAGGSEVTLSFSSGSPGDAYSSGKIAPLGLGKYAWHVPNAVFASLGNVSAVLSVTGGIDVHFEWLVVAAVRDAAAFGANTTAPATPTNVTDARDAVLTKLPTSERAAGASTVASIYTVVQLTDASVALLPSASANAAAVRTNLATELGRIDVNVSSRLAPATAGRTITVSTTGVVTAELDPAVRVKLDATQPDYAPATASALATTHALLQLTDTDVAAIEARLPSDPADQSLVTAATDAVMARLGAPAGASIAADIAAIDASGGDASQTTLLAVKAKTDLIGSAAAMTELFAAAVLTPGAITSFPETLRIGDSYTDVLGRAIQLPIVDEDGVSLSSAGSKSFADATATFVIKRANDTEDARIITGSATFIDPPGTGTGEVPYALIEIPSSETAKGLVKYRYTGLLTFTWPYVGTGTDSEVMTFETGTITFEA